MRQWLDYYWHKLLHRPYTLARKIDKGQGQPVVFLHGLASSGDSWRQVTDLLDEKQYRVIAFDLLGFGTSPQPDWLMYSVDDHADAVLASLRRMGIREPVILVGHSMGSLVATHIAQKHPKKVAHVILYQMPVYSAVPSLKARDFRRRAYVSTFQYLAGHPKMTLWYAQKLGRAASRVVGFTLDEKNWQPFELSLRNTILQPEPYENLRALTMPTDVIYGRYDMLVLKKNLKHYFHPAEHLRFYEIKETHRISARTADLLRELITQDPQKREMLTIKHARLVEMSDTKKFPIVKPTPPAPNKKAYGLFAAFAAVICVITTIAASAGTVGGWERDVFDYLNGWQAPGYVTWFARLGSDLVWASVFLVAALFLFKKYFWTAWQVAIPAASAYITVFIAEHLVGRARPEVLLPGEAMLRATQDGMGFPSGHMATMTAIVVTLWPRLSWPLRALGVLLLAWVGWSRIYLGVHFPLDIIAGFAVGIGIVCIIQVLPNSIRKRLKLA